MADSRRIFFLLAGIISLVVISFSVLFFGGEREPAIALIQSLIVPIFLLGCSGFSRDSISLKALYRPLHPYGFLLFLFLLFVSVQYGMGLQIMHGGIGSVYPFRTLEFLIQLLVYILFFLVMVRLTADRELVRRGGSILAWLIFILSLMSVLQALSGVNKPIFWRSYFGTETDPFGPFFNNDDFGAFLVLFFPWTIAMTHYRAVCSRRLFDEYQSETGASLSFSQRFAILNQQGFVFFLGLTFFLFGACFLARARSALMAMFFILTAYVFKNKPTNRGRAVTGYLIFLALSGMFFFYLGDQTLFREYIFGQLWKDLLQRISMMSESWEIWKQFPLWGTGLGTYGFISPQFITFYRDLFHTFYAFNDYVELFTETGLIGGGLFLTAIVGMFLKLVLKNPHSRSLWKRLMRFQAILAILGLAFLENISYHLKVPAIALMFIVQFSILYSTSISTRDLQVSGAQQEVGGGRFFNYKKMILPVIVAVGLVLFVSKSLSVFVLNQNQSETVLVRAVEIFPAKAELWHKLAAYREAQYNFENQENPGTLSAAIESMERATALAPTYGYYWFYLGTLLDRQGKTDAAVRALKQSIFWGPHFYRHHFYLIKLYLRECLKATEPVQKKKLSLEARSVYREMMRLRIPPPEWRIRHGMGESGYKTLKKFVVLWDRYRD